MQLSSKPLHSLSLSLHGISPILSFLFFGFLSVGDVLDSELEGHHKPSVDFADGDRIFVNVFFVETFKVLPDELKLLILFELAILWSYWPVLIHLEKDRLSRVVVHELGSLFPGKFVGVSLAHLLARVEVQEVD